LRIKGWERSSASPLFETVVADLTLRLRELFARGG
jgi:hypothetical protein